MGARECRLEIKCFEVFWKIVRDLQKRTLQGSEFRRVGADTRKEHKQEVAPTSGRFGAWNMKKFGYGRA